MIEKKLNEKQTQEICDRITLRMSYNYAFGTPQHKRVAKIKWRLYNHRLDLNNDEI